MRTSARATLPLLLLATVQLAPAQTPPSETARKHLESGILFYEQQRYKQALADFEIVASMADSEYADDALLRIGEYHLEIDKDFGKAREYFDRVLQAYPAGDGAPGAYYYLGVVILRSGVGEQNVDDALANFQRVIMLYPQSPWVPAALYSTGVALERRGAWEAADDSYFRVVSEYPRSRWAAGAQLAMGRCSVRRGDAVQGMVEIQRVRNDYPDSREAEEAVDWLTHLFRFYGYPLLGQPVSYKVDSTFNLALTDKLKDVEAIRVSEQAVHVLERGRGRLLLLDRSGKLLGTRAASDPRGLFIDPAGTVVVANEKGLLIGERPVVFAVPQEKGPKPLEAIGAAVRDRLGRVFLYDGGEKGVLQFDPAGKLIGPFPDSSQREILRLELDLAGNLILLDKKDRAATVYTPGGQRVARIERRGGKWDLKKPTDIAVDPAGYFYVLDEEQSQVAVFDPSYSFVVLLWGPSLGGGVLKKPTALDVDASGDIYVYDDETKTLLRFH